MNNNKQNKARENRFLIIILIIFFLFPGSELQSAENNKYYSLNIDKKTIEKGYTVTAFDDDLKLSLVPGILSESTDVEIVRLNEDLSMPWQVDKISHVYQFEFKNKKAYDNHKPYYIQFSYLEENNNYKQVFFYDKNYSSWRPLPTRDYPEEKFVRSLIHLPFARIAVFSYPKILTSGRASWYGYKGGNFAASPDYPKGSRVRVYNRENGKFVDVEINDYGPDRSIFPDRPIDLDKIAFSKIASLGEGVVDVLVEPLYIKPDSYEFVIGVPSTGIKNKPDINLKSGIIMNEKSGEIIFSKNSTSILPLASLTKMVTVKVFLGTGVDLKKEIIYLDKDETYNHEWCKPWESAKLSVGEGEILTVEDLIYSALVGSANNAIETLVRASGLSRTNFIAKMNKTVKSWGASSTLFIEPTGLAPDNVSSVYDYAIITKEVIKEEIIEKASTAKEYKFTTVNTEKPHRIRNTNHLIKTNKFHITGSKTGYLDEAGYCLMTRVKGDNGNIIIVTFGAESRDLSFYETDKLINYGLKIN